MSDPLTVLVDAHAHLHSSYEPRSFLDAAARNFRGARDRLGSAATLGCLIFTEDPRERSFADVLARLRSVGAEWNIDEGDDAVSAWARPPEGSPILLLAGRQLPTREGLELLALCSDDPFDVGMALEEAMDAVSVAGAVPVIPWGFGKWWFARGAVLRQRVEGSASPRFFLGDQAGRPAWGAEPKLFARARQRGVLTLPGSDPLPFRRHQDRAGSFGFVLPAELSDERPGIAVRERLLALAAQPDRYGVGVGFGEFVQDQISMQVRKRASGRDG